MHLLQEICYNVYRYEFLCIEKQKKYCKMSFMLVGSRQTGNTYILEDFCKNNFNNYVYINSDKNKMFYFGEYDNFDDEEK